MGRRSILTVAAAAGAIAATMIGAAAATTVDSPTSALRNAAGATRAAALYQAIPPSPVPAPVASTGDGGTATARIGAGPRRELDWKVGFARETLDPTPAMLIAGFHLGGYGLGPTRPSIGPLVDGDGTVEHLYARATAISNRKGETLLLAALENQGTFAAYKQGPYGIWDIRRQVAKDTGVPVEQIVVNSDHSHAGPDMIGLWGGVPVDYMKELFSQTVKALDEAYQRRVPADLRLGTNVPAMPDAATGRYLKGTATPGEDFVHSQFGRDSGQNGAPGTGYDDSAVDTQLRVLQAIDGRGRPLGTLINYAAHATVMGGGNLRYSADWPGRVARATEVALREPVAVTMVADVGRSQPPRPHSDAGCDRPGHPSCDVDALDTWARLFTPWVVDAAMHAVPVQGNQVGGQEVFTREVATNPALLGVSYSGEAPTRGTGAYRAVTAPWVTGDVIGSFASAHRLGNILLTANPGEAYPDIRFGVAREIVKPQAFFTFGLANDQLGYLIAPASEYPWISYSQLGNDNSFFNVSVRYGDHLYCTEAAAAVAVGFTATNDPQPYGPGAQQPVCAGSSQLDQAPMGPAPQQPWVIGDGLTLPAGT